jgi:hypothetical protein
VAEVVHRTVTGHPAASVVTAAGGPGSTTVLA